MNLCTFFFQKATFLIELSYVFNAKNYVINELKYGINGPFQLRWIT